jgi:hypothetical protein
MIHSSPHVQNHAMAGYDTGSNSLIITTARDNILRLSATDSMSSMEMLGGVGGMDMEVFGNDLGFDGGVTGFAYVSLLILCLAFIACFLLPHVSFPAVSARISIHTSASISRTRSLTQ